MVFSMIITKKVKILVAVREAREKNLKMPGIPLYALLAAGR